MAQKDAREKLVRFLDEKVKDNYLSDLSSSTGKEESGELEDLGLPKRPDVRDEFMEPCDKLGVK